MLSDPAHLTRRVIIFSPNIHKLKFIAYFIEGDQNLYQVILSKNFLNFCFTADCHGAGDGAPAHRYV
jgi:hypothetical protein